MKGPLPPTRLQPEWKILKVYFSRSFTVFMLLLGSLACQPEKTSNLTGTEEKNLPANEANNSDSLIEEIKETYQKRIDSLLTIQNQGKIEIQNQVAVLRKRATALETDNKNLDNQIGQQSDVILKLQDSLQSVINKQGIEKNTHFTPIALTDAALNTLTFTRGPAFTSKAYDLFDSTRMKLAFAQEVDSLIQEIDDSNNRVVEQGERLDGILSNLAISIEPESKKTSKNYEDVIISTLLSTISDDTLLVNQYKRGFYSKQDLNALVSDYKLRKTQKSTAGEIVIYRRKKKQDSQIARIRLDGFAYAFPRNQIDTIKVDNVFNVTVCDIKDQCETLAFSSKLSNYAEVSLRKNTNTIMVKPINQALGQFYARQVSSTQRNK